MEEVLKKFGPVSLVGKSFGVFRSHRLDVDFSVPRKDSSGRKPEVEIDPFMSFEDAFSRRDLTINAMGIDLLSYDLVDPFDGQKDLANKTLSCPDKTKFTEDPLRFYRVMQFIGRFEMYPDNELNDICKNMDISKVSTERISSEFEKLFLKSRRPSLGIRWLKDIDRLREILPQLADTVEIKQEPKWHPEGDVFEHTMQCVDAAANINRGCAIFEIEGEGSREKDLEKLIIIYAALCHDLGKFLATTIVDGKIKSIGHERVGVKLAKKLLSKITKNKDLIEAAVKLVQYHMVPCQLVDSNSKPAAYKRLVAKLAPNVTMQMIAKICLADKQGRNPESQEPLTSDSDTIEKFLKISKDAHVDKKPEAAVLLGRDLISEIKPGPQMGKLLKLAYKIQIDQGIIDKQELKNIVMQELVSVGDK
ncbi:MAG: polynucleotide adenylyltransferase region [uncultured bacterium]|nr:MAG: polynucleotide adenylyltransferase region [uncultured bacterium]